MATNEDLEKLKAALESNSLDSYAVADSTDSINIDIDDMLISIDNTVDLNLFSHNTMNWSPTASSTGNITINTGASGFNGTSASAGYLYSPMNTSNVTIGAIGSTMSSPGFQVSGDATFDGDIKWKGRSLSKLFEKIEDRLAILQDPDPKKLEKYEALKKAYEHYKTLERLIGEE